MGPRGTTKPRRGVAVDDQDAQTVNPDESTTTTAASAENGTRSRRVRIRYAPSAGAGASAPQDAVPCATADDACVGGDDAGSERLRNKAASDKNKRKRVCGSDDDYGEGHDEHGGPRRRTPAYRGRNQSSRPSPHPTAGGRGSRGAAGVGSPAGPPGGQGQGLPPAVASARGPGRIPRTWEDMSRFARPTSPPAGGSAGARGATVAVPASIVRPSSVTTPSSVAMKEKKRRASRAGPKEARRATLYVEPLSLQDMCINFICDNIAGVESFGPIGTEVQVKLCRRLARIGKLHEDSLRLFLETSLEELHVSNGTSLNVASLRLVPLMCPNLKRLTLSGCGRADDSIIDLLASQCPLLEELSLFETYLVTDEPLVRFFEAHESLTSFSLSWAHLLSGSAIASLARECTNLRTLELRMCGGMSDSVLACIKSLRHLESLVIESPGDLLSDAGLTEALSGCASNLKVVELSDVQQVTALGFIAALEPCVHLETLVLDRSPHVDDACVARIVSRNRLLSRISLRNCVAVTSVTLAMLTRAECRGKLVQLGLGGLAAVTGGAIESFVDAVVDFPNDMDADGNANHAADDADPAVNVEVVRARVRRVAKGKGKASSEAVTTRAGHSGIPPGLPLLSDIDFSWVRDVTDDTVMKLLDGCPRLKRMMLWGCSAVSADLSLAAAWKRGVEVVGALRRADEVD